jgi:hypothetical protein
VHALAASTALVATIAGLATGSAPWLVVGGVAFVASGALALGGIQLTLHGPLGAILRRVVGTFGVGWARAGAVLWIAIGVTVILLGALRLVGDGGAPDPRLA